MHANRMQLLNHKNNNNSLIARRLTPPTRSKPNAGLIQIALVTSALASALWWRKNGSTFSKGGLDRENPLLLLGSFLQRILGGSGRKIEEVQKNDGQWKKARPATMAATAAAQRAQVRIFYFLFHLISFRHSIVLL